MSAIIKQRKHIFKKRGEMQDKVATKLHHNLAPLFYFCVFAPAVNLHHPDYTAPT